MADGQPGSPSEEQATQASPEVAELKATLAVLQKQLEETKHLASEKADAHTAATRKMHEALNQLDQLKKQAEQAKADITEEEAAKLFDNPKHALDYTTKQAREIAERMVVEKFGQLDGKIELLAEEIAKAIVERDRAQDSRLRTLDPRYQSPGFKAAKEKYKDILSDDQILQMVELDGKSKGPSAPAGNREVTTQRQETDVIAAGVKELFGATLARYERKQ